MTCSCYWKGNSKNHAAGQHCTHPAVYLVEMFGEYGGRFEACGTHARQARTELEAKNVPLRVTMIVTAEQAEIFEAAEHGARG